MSPQGIQRLSEAKPMFSKKVMPHLHDPEAERSEANGSPESEVK